MAKKKGFRLATFTFIGFLALFLLFSIIGVWIYGWDKIAQEIVSYIIGASAFGMALAVVLFVLRKQIWKK